MITTNDYLIMKTEELRRSNADRKYRRQQRRDQVSCDNRQPRKKPESASLRFLTVLLGQRI